MKGRHTNLINIYNHPKKYAKSASCSINTAVLRCELFLDLHKRVDMARICPRCGKPSIDLEYVNEYDGSRSEQVICSKCQFKSVITDRFKPLQWFEFAIDIALFGSKCKELFSVSWDDYINNDTAELYKVLSED
jgi:hypothetical protein